LSCRGRFETCLYVCPSTGAARQRRTRDSGFSEFGTQEGRGPEREVKQLAEHTGVRIIGPNCMGIHSPKACFCPTPDFPKESGRVALLSRSGGNTLYLVRAAGARNIRFSKVISYGNPADIDETDLLSYFQQDKETDMIAAYTEGVKDGRRWQCTTRPTWRAGTWLTSR